VVAITTDLPERSLYRGQVGIVVEILAPGVFEVEFSDDEGAPTLLARSKPISS